MRPAWVRFGKVDSGSVAEFPVQIFNLGERPISVEVTVIEPVGLELFAIARDSAANSQTKLGPATVPENQHIVLVVRYTPEFEGFHEGKIQYDIDVGIEPFVQNVQATAVPPLPDEPDIHVTPSAHDFGPVPVGDLASVNLVLQNLGAVDLELGTVEFVGDDGFFLDVTNPSGVILAAEEELSLPVGFLPTIAGFATTLLQVPSNDPDTPLLDIVLAGTGI